MSKLIAIEPKSFPEYEAAVVAGGGQLVDLNSSVRAVIWTDYTKPAELAAMLEANPQIEWVQLPFAGVDAFADIISRPIQFTSAKGAYREPVAEHALALTLALLRILPERARSLSWGRRFAPFNPHITVVRKSSEPLAAAAATVSFEKLESYLPEADVVILAAALTEETRHLFNSQKLALMKPSAVLVNVARGPMVVTKDLIESLNSDQIAGAALDVTDPEPLPDGHELWSAKNILITPHTADTREMVVRLFAERITANVAAYCADGPWVGAVDASLGY